MNKNAAAGARKKGRRLGTGAKGSIDLKRKLEQALRSVFPRDTIDITDGYKGNVHVMVVSRLFDGKSEYERQGMLHEIIDSSGVSSKQRGQISLLLALSPGELK
jgi:hypothetical protein